MTLYMAVTPDELELPVAVESTMEDLAETFNTTKSSVATSISKNRISKRSGVKFIRVNVY